MIIIFSVLVCQDSDYQIPVNISFFVHDIYASFDCCPSLQLSDILLDISKAFDQVWHEGLICKLPAVAISGLPLKCIESFLPNRFQRVLLNGQSSSYGHQNQLVCLKDLSQDLYLNYVEYILIIYLKVYNQLPNSLQMILLFFSVVHDISLSSFQLNDDLFKISNWAYQWKISFNPKVVKQAQEVIFLSQNSGSHSSHILFQ